MSLQNPRIESAEPRESHTLSVRFSNGERRRFDVSPYLGIGVFRELRDPGVFRGVRVVAGSLEWPGEIDLGYDTVYLESVAE